MMQIICKRMSVFNYDSFCGAGVNCISDNKQPEEKMILSDVHGFPYSANNVIVDNAIVLYISCNTGDRSSNMLDRACIRKLCFLFFLPCVIVRIFCFVTILGSAGIYSKTTTSRFFNSARM